MYAAAPRLDRRLREAIGRLDRADVPMAETYRSMREEAAKLDIPRPSYELTRQVIRQVRRDAERRRTYRSAAFRVLLYQLPTRALYDLDSARSRPCAKL